MLLEPTADQYFTKRKRSKKKSINNLLYHQCNVHRCASASRHPPNVRPRTSGRPIRSAPLPNLYKLGTGSALALGVRPSSVERRLARSLRSLGGAGSASPRSGTHGRRPMRANMSKHVQACASKRLVSEPLFLFCCLYFLCRLI